MTTHPISFLKLICSFVVENTACILFFLISNLSVVSNVQFQPLKHLIIIVWYTQFANLNFNRFQHGQCIFFVSLSLVYVFWDIWSWLAILELFNGFCNHRQAHFSPAMRPWHCLGDNTVTPTASSTAQRSCRQKAGQLWERWFIVMDGLDHPPSAHRIWQEPNIPAVCQDFKGIEPPGFPQLINKQELWSQLTDLLLGEKRNQWCFVTSSLSLVPAAASAVLTGAAPAHAELCPSHTPVPKLGGDKNGTRAVI